MGLAAVAALCAWSTVAQAQVYGSSSYLANNLGTTVRTARASRANLTFVSCYNASNAVAYVQLFDVAGSVTLGTTVPRLSLGIPTAGQLTAQVNVQFLNALKAAATTTPTGSSAPSASVDCNFGLN